MQPLTSKGRSIAQRLLQAILAGLEFENLRCRHRDMSHGQGSFKLSQSVAWHVSPKFYFVLWGCKDLHQKVWHPCKCNCSLSKNVNVISNEPDGFRFLGKCSHLDCATQAHVKCCSVCFSASVLLVFCLGIRDGSDFFAVSYGTPAQKHWMKIPRMPTRRESRSLDFPLPL